MSELGHEPSFRQGRYTSALAAGVGGGAAATAGAIATAPFRAFDNRYNNYYGYGYGGRDWKTYAAHNGLGPTFRPHLGARVR